MFKLISETNTRRKGVIKTKNGEIKTPFFMPDATRGFVKSISGEDLKKSGVQPMVVNTYHLYLNPGMETIKKSGGINNFMNWSYPLLSDSGGYQVFSLIHKNPKLGKITEDEVIFRSPVDGAKHILTPEKAIQIQFDLGVDMMVCLDDVPPNNYPEEKIKEAVERTIIWAQRCKIEYEKQIKKRKISDSERPLLFGVIQGGKYGDLRKYCADELVRLDFDGYGFGARHVDENGVFMEDMIRETAQMIPKDKLRFALGVGTPEDIARCVKMGWDIFDCVIPTREGRHGRLFVWDKQSEFSIFNFQFSNNFEISNSKIQKFYNTININNEKFKEDFSSLDTHCDCELCENHSKSYLHHLFAIKDPLAQRLASMHNLKFYMDLMKELRYEK
ncbi:MAG TPA: tRNA guanosine(34) transglycosylase Tgt [Candidatus Moranbacteria bacterium]|nr:tRNA guanosine(34) transglycosylase Tgt [Candidatus Moranbacteria bacterium]HAT74839.1 tRNA guanosine(34) transglycosylase Tgt [Candidatus Moranbacteria bacterium]